MPTGLLLAVVLEWGQAMLRPPVVRSSARSSCSPGHWASAVGVELHYHHLVGLGGRQVEHVQQGGEGEHLVHDAVCLADLQGAAPTCGVLVAVEQRSDAGRVQERHPLCTYADLSFGSVARHPRPVRSPG